MPKSEFYGLPIIEAPDSEEITVAVKPDDLQKRDMSGREKVLHVKNVDFNRRSAGFRVRHSLGLSLGLLLLDFSYVSHFWLNEQPQGVVIALYWSAFWLAHSNI